MYITMAVFTMCFLLVADDSTTDTWNEAFAMLIMSILWPITLGIGLGIIYREQREK